MTQPARKKSLAERKAELQARLSQIEARERDARRKAATRSRIVLGGALLARATILVQQKDPNAASFIRFLKDLTNEITRPADATTKSAIEHLLAGMESELVKPPPLAKQPLSASPAPDKVVQLPEKPAQPSLAPVRTLQPSRPSEPSQTAQQPSQTAQQPSQQWSTAKPRI